jgi:hypothetical protein
MNYSVKSIEPFEKHSKRLIKKYPSLKKEIFELAQELKVNPVQGTAIGSNCFKIRLSIASKGKGKRGGARIITYLLIEGQTVYLLDIYDKSEQSSISDKELQQLLKEIK